MNSASISGNVASSSPHINSFAFRQDGSSDAETIIADNLRVGTSFAQVVTEPSTYALIFGGLALGVVVFVKRRANNREEAG